MLSAAPNHPADQSIILSVSPSFNIIVNASRPIKQLMGKYIEQQMNQFTDNHPFMSITRCKLRKNILGIGKRADLCYCSSKSDAELLFCGTHESAHARSDTFCDLQSPWWFSDGTVIDSHQRK